MLEYFKKWSLYDFGEYISLIVQRFPFSIVYALGSSILFSYYANFNTPDWTVHIGLIGILLFMASTGTTLFFENTFQKKFPAILIQIGIFLYGVLFYYQVPFQTENDLFFSLYISHLVGFFCILFIGNKQNFGNNKVYSKFIYDLSIAIFRGALFGIIIGILGTIALGVINELFGEGKFFHIDILIQNWWIYSIGLVSTIRFLGDIPREKNNETVPKFFFHILFYVTIPALIIYFIILYSYSFKILLDIQNWPSSIVSGLIIAFSIFGYKIYLFSQYWEEEKKHIMLIRRAIPFIMLPQIIFLFYALYLRISQYDVTPARYLGVVFGIFLLIMSWYYIFSKTKKLAMFPLLIGLGTLFINIGPWSINTFPIERQKQVLIEQLKKANMYENGKIIPLKKEISLAPKLQNNIVSQINYLCDTQKCHPLIELFSQELSTIPLINKWENFDSQKDTYFFDVTKKELCKKENKSLCSMGWREKEIITASILAYLQIKEISQESNYPKYYSNSFDIFPIEIQGKNIIFEIDTQDKKSLLSQKISFQEDTQVLQIENEVYSLEKIIKNIDSIEKMGNIGKEQSNYSLSNKTNTSITLILKEISIENKKIKSIKGYILK